MSNSINIAAVALPLSVMSNAFSGLFGGSGSNDYSTMRLLNVQMQMLENMSSKIDVIQEGIEFIIENQEKIKQLIETIPSKTVSELYRKDLEGIFVLIREKIEAYAIERAKNKEKANKIFQPIFNEILTIIQVSRAKIFRLDNYLDLPVVSTCLHFEIFCMVLAEQPKSLIEVTLKSYKRWIENHLTSKLKEGIDEKALTLIDYYTKSRQKQNDLVENSKKLYTYTKCLSEKGIEQGGEGTGDFPYYPIDTYKIEFKKFRYELENALSEEHNQNLTLLIEKGFIANQELPSKITIPNGFESFTHPFASDVRYSRVGDNTVIDPKQKSNFYYNAKISDDFYVYESDYSIANETILCSIVDATNNNPQITSQASTISDEIIDNGYKLIIYASLVNIAKETIHIIDKFLAEPQNLNKDSILSFGYELEKFSRIYNERAIEWVKFIDEKAEQIEDAEQKAKLKALRDEMDNLKANEKNILLEYKRLETEISENMDEDLLTEILGILGSIGKELERGVQNIGRETEVLVQNLGNNLEKAIQNTVDEFGRAVNNVGEAIEAAVIFAENQIESWGETLSDAEKRVREGKIIDAIWHLGVDPLKHGEENIAIAMQTSSLLNNVATAAASIYGGPQGAAAYAAWLTYKQTKNLDLALKTGIIAGLTSQGIQFANGLPADGITELTKRTLVTSSIGAVSIAASGGSEEDIINGFLKGAALSVAREYYRTVTKLEIEGKAPTQDAGPKLNEDYIKENKFLRLYYDDGEPVYQSYLDPITKEFKVIHAVDVSSMPRSISMVGLASALNNEQAGLLSLAETGVPMRLVAELPYANDMAYFHDIWCDNVIKSGYNLSSTEIVVTIIPATIITVAGSDTPLITQIVEEINKHVSN